MTPLIIVGGIVGGFFTPTEASVVAVVYSLFLGVAVYRSVKPREIPKVLYESARFAALSLFCIGTASAFGWCLAFFKIPAALVAQIEMLGLGVIGTGVMCALAFLLIGMFIDAVPAIIILGTVLFPVTQHVGMHPIHFAIIGVVSLGFGLVTPPYGLCLLITASIGKIRLIDAMRDVIVILIPMLGVLMFIIVAPDVILALPRLIMPKYIQ
ncbi:MAG: TRAP transporter large permease subunit, partial [Alphaproteobacteria bacterium]